MPAETPRNSIAAATCAQTGRRCHHCTLPNADCTLEDMKSGGDQCASCARTPRNAATSAPQRAHIGRCAANLARSAGLPSPASESA